MVLLTDVLDVVNGTALEAPLPPTSGGHGLNPTELRGVRYLPTNLSRPEIPGNCRSRSTPSIRISVTFTFAKLRATDRSSALQRARGLRLFDNGVVH